MVISSVSTELYLNRMRGPGRHYPSSQPQLDPALRYRTHSPKVKPISKRQNIHRYLYLQGRKFFARRLHSFLLLHEQVLL